MKIPLKNKIFAWYLRRGVILTKDNLIKRNWHGSPWCVFCHHDETIKHLFFQYKLVRSIWSVIQIASSLYLPCSVANVFGNWLHGIDHRFRTLSGWERLPLFGRFVYVEMIRFLTIKVLLLCRLSTDVPGRFVYGPLYNKWRIETCLRRCVHDWRLRGRILLANMGGSMILGLGLLPFRCHTDIHLYIPPSSFILACRDDFVGCVHLSYAEAGCNA